LFPFPTIFFGVFAFLQYWFGKPFLLAPTGQLIDYDRSSRKPNNLKERNLREYEEHKLRYQVADLQQYARNGRARGETVDLALPTLTTNSGKLYHKAWQRFTPKNQNRFFLLDSQQYGSCKCTPVKMKWGGSNKILFSSVAPNRLTFYY